MTTSEYEEKYRVENGGQYKEMVHQLQYNAENSSAINQVQGHWSMLSHKKTDMLLELNENKIREASATRNVQTASKS